MPVGDGASEHVRQMKDMGLPTVRRLVLLMSSMEAGRAVDEDVLQRLDAALREEDAQRVRQQSAQLVLSIVVDMVAGHHAEDVAALTMPTTAARHWHTVRAVAAGERFIRLLKQLARSSSASSSSSQPARALLFTAEPVVETEMNTIGVDDYVATNWILFLVVTVCAGYALIRDDPPAMDTMSHAPTRSAAAISSVGTGRDPVDRPAMANDACGYAENDGTFDDDVLLILLILDDNDEYCCHCC
ncbi:hypothetical protein SYNPS1DRAFT_29443 [Syncephalis pseudoplumigaleata]|uniref:Uncharacterized protein n=1 Tax=Syncephalis pseudoplumigaleata TaxID=1712513 RepID=A0A4P9YXZ2_9FUNG|nr:hypothetical protein SYNPS1DRAFT_29443 [Syncephalis pseudoplumigaleata]|eukprot:RKP24808.1 hypothetical protein SYNPS1DRAFT_29443 [Syncephalis pseudoplumigaleata]